jgi:long-chain acyl-CoA synthetase
MSATRITLAPTENLLRPIIERAEREPERPLFAYEDGGRFVDVSAADVTADIRALAKGLIASGVQPGDRVVIMSPTRIEWALLDHAILMAGAVTVPIFDTSSPVQIQWIAEDSGAVMAFVADDALAATLSSSLGDADEMRETLVIDGGALGTLRARGEAVPDEAVEERSRALGPSDLATIMYTSGTTGRPKGCVLTHGNLRSDVLQAREVLQPLVREDDSLLLFLPLAHSFAKILLLVPIDLGMKIAFSDLLRVRDHLPLAEPTWVASVPRVFEKVYNTAQHKAEVEGKGRIFDRAAETAIEYSRARHAGQVRFGLRLRHGIFDRLVYGKLRAAFGGELRAAFSGGGPLGARLTHFFDGAGIEIYEGYGLTETSPVLTMNAPDAWRVGSIGRPLPDTEVRIGEDGEILVRGPQVFQGYWRNVAATNEAIDEEGWFHTGDVGHVDDDGYVWITGRKKDLIVTAAGKNVAPAPLEDELRAHPLISQAMVVGEGRPFIAALITIDEEAFATWAEEHGLDEPVVSERTTEHPELVAEIQQAVDEANALVSRAESIRRFEILPHDFTIELGELTPTLKVKRDVVEDHERDAIERIYAG